MNFDKLSWYKAKNFIARRKNEDLLNAKGSASAASLSAAQARDSMGEELSPLQEIFLNTQSPSVYKWLHYLPLYEQYFSRFRGTSFKMLEIGIFNGGSIAMWREYFGPDATIFGIDINPHCADHVHAPNAARIGSQADPAFLRSVIEEMGGVDLILDDGSHIAEHQAASFDVLFPLLTPGGTYAIEDLHTAYWPGPHQGGYKRGGTAIEEAKKLVDDLHHWYHPFDFATTARDMVTGVHFHDSIVFIDKAKQSRPVAAQIGRDENPVTMW